jgi:ubiquinone/menaquinone biosynthesis C-methylase UbiE
MSKTSIHHAYNDIVATHYDLDPQGLIGESLDRGIAQLKEEGFFDSDRELDVLDVGMGTGLFLEKLKKVAGDQVMPFGIDLADNMLEVARRKMPDLEAIAGDASSLEDYFPGKEFDCVCTHFMTGYVGMNVLAPQIARRLKPGGYWSLIGGTKKAYTALQAKGDSKLLRWLSGVGSREVDDTVLNPADLAEVSKTMAAHGLEVRQGDTFEPALNFENFDTFMEFGYRGGWLTPLIESMGLHEAGPAKRWLINRLVFPVRDAHNIVLALGQKP